MDGTRQLESSRKKGIITHLLDFNNSTNLQRSVSPNEGTRKSPIKKNTARKEREIKSGINLEVSGLERQNSNFSEKEPNVVKIRDTSMPEIISDSEAVLTESKEYMLKTKNNEIKISHSVPAIVNQTQSVERETIKLGQIDSTRHFISEDDRISGNYFS